MIKFICNLNIFKHQAKVNYKIEFIKVNLTHNLGYYLPTKYSSLISYQTKSLPLTNIFKVKLNLHLMLHKESIMSKLIPLSPLYPV